MPSQITQAVSSAPMGCNMSGMHIDGLILHESGLFHGVVTDYNVEMPIITVHGSSSASPVDTIPGRSQSSMRMRFDDDTPALPAIEDALRIGRLLLYRYRICPSGTHMPMSQKSLPEHMAMTDLV